MGPGQHMGLDNMSPRRFVAGFCLALIAAMPVRAQDFPARPVKIITDSAPGSAVDVVLRVIADRLTQIWGQQVLPVNQPGAGGSVAAARRDQGPAVRASPA